MGARAVSSRLADLLRAAGFAAALLAGFGPGPGAAQEGLRIAAVVNDEVISDRDLANRVQVVLASSGLPDTPDERQRVTPQVLRSLIDEKLQMQEAKRLSIAVTDQDIEEAIQRIEQGNHLPTGGLNQEIVKLGLKKESVFDQIRASLAWNKVVRAQLAGSIQVGDDEVDEILSDIQRTQNVPQYRYSEILLAVDDPAREDQIHADATRLAEQIRGGANFAAVAQQFSAAATASSGGEVGWVLQDQIEPAIVQAFRTMKPAQVSDPIRTLSGFEIVLLEDMRTIDSSAPAEAVVRLKQIILPLEQNGGADQVEAKTKEAEALAQQAKSCDDMDRLAEQVKSPVPSSLGRFKIGELSPALRSVVTALKPGEASQPVRLPTGIAVLMVCERSDPSTEMTNRDDIRDQLFRGKLQNMTRRYMRDLRRAAFLEVRS
jgi:peptidyl-prolyl cis-trans isomerase SurA